MRVQVRDPNVALMDAYDAIYAPKVHAGRPAHLGHGPRERLPAFYVQLEAQDLKALAVPRSMEQPLKIGRAHV